MQFPEVRQDRRPGSATFGAVAVAQEEGSPLGPWGFMTGKTGGGGCTFAQIADWTVLTGGDE